jgi:hypothetical protein
MAEQRYAITGYSVLELNQVAFPTTGEIEAQCKFDYYTPAKGTTPAHGVFKTLSTDANGVTCEVGMLLAVDKANDIVTLPTAANVDECAIGLNYTTEYIYNQFTKGLNKFAMTQDIAGGEYLPRIGYLTKGDKFTTNCLAYDTAEFADDDAVDAALAAYKTTPVFGGVSTTGAIKLTATRPTSGPVLRVVKDYTLPDGISHGVMFQVLEG